MFIEREKQKENEIHLIAAAAVVTPGPHEIMILLMDATQKEKK